MKIKRILCRAALATVIAVILCACGTDNTSHSGEVNEQTSDFPAAPDKIVIGGYGEEKELLPGDEEFGEVLYGIKARISSGSRLSVMTLAPEAYDVGELREDNIYVEYIYNEAAEQSYPTYGEGGSYITEIISPKRVFFSLTGEFHQDVILGADDEYTEKSAIGRISDSTELIRYISAALGVDVTGGVTDMTEK